MIGATAVLTASSSYDVGPTPYYLEIFDQTTGARVAICGSGTSCSGSVSYNYATTHTYVAYVARYGTTNPPPGIYQYGAGSQVVTWSAVALNATAPGSNGGSSTITATVGYNVGPTPYYIEIFDQSTGARVAICGSGTSCAASISYPGTTTHTYIAYIASAGLTNPPPNIQATSNTVSVSWYYLG